VSEPNRRYRESQQIRAGSERSLQLQLAHDTHEGNMSTRARTLSKLVRLSTHEKPR
jgi:hypothetical protein